MGNSQAVYNSLDVASVVENGLRVIESGYQAVKVVFIPYVNYTASVSEIRQVSRMMESLREAVGDEIDIMVDFHGRPGSASAAVQFIKALEPYSPLLCRRSHSAR
jgi:galactonate dehydratase